MKERRQVGESVSIRCEAGKDILEEELPEMRPFRCVTCGRYLLSENVTSGFLRVRCRSCKTDNVLGILARQD